jgi:CspA family cold shock protein
LNRDRNFRQPRRREFDDDNYDSRPREFGAPRMDRSFEVPTGPPVRAVVKWFRADRGFGFVELADGSGDAFLHASVLDRNSLGPVQPGETLEVRVGQGQKGPQVTEIISVDSSTATPAAPRRPPPMGGGGGMNRMPGEVSAPEPGTVKWFNAQKGFGFVVRESGGKDAFVHVSVLERSGLAGLNEGQRVMIEVAEGRKGPEAVSIRLA